jgi:hypothetical protein
VIGPTIRRYRTSGDRRRPDLVAAKLPVGFVHGRSEATFTVIADKMRRRRGIKISGGSVEAVETPSRRYLFNDAEKAGVLRALCGHVCEQGMRAPQSAGHILVLV